MNYVLGKILQRQSFILKKGLPPGWFLGWKAVSTRKTKSLEKNEVFLVVRRKKLLMRCLQSYYTLFFETTNRSSQKADTAFISLINKTLNEKNWLEKAKEEINKFNEAIAHIFCKIINEIYSYDTNVCNISPAVHICSRNEIHQEKLSGLLYSAKSNEFDSALENIQLKRKETSKINVLFQGDKFIFSETKFANDVIKELEYAIQNPVSDTVISNALLKAKSLEFEEMHPTFFVCYYRALMKLDKDSAVYKENRKFFFELVTRATIRRSNAKHLVLFLSTYADYIKLGREKYSKKVILSITQGVKKSNMTIDDKFCLLKSLVLMRHNDMSIVESIKDVIIENPAPVEESVENLHIFLEALGNIDFPNVRKKKRFWPFIRNFISELQILKNVDKWKEAELFYHLNVAKVLALYGIHSRSVYNSLWEKCNNEPLSDDKEILSVMVVLNQAIYALHPSFNKSFLNENVLSASEIKLEENCEKLNEFTNDVKETLEWEIYELDCIIKNCYTKQGLKIDLVMALNEKNEPYSFTKFLKCPKKKMYIEEISLLKEFQLILIILVDLNNHGVFNFHQLDSETQLKLKSLQAMGYMTIPIAKGHWDFIQETERATYFWKMIIKRNKCIIPENLLEKAREPDVFD